MNFYEYYIERLQKRIKKIEENPDPTKLKSNKIRYEIQLELAREQLEAWREGRPFSEGGGFMAGTLVRSMGFLPTGSVGSAYITGEPDKYLEQARAKGLPVDNSCDMTSMPFAMAECGDMPKEDLYLCDQHACTPMLLSHIFTSHSQKQHTFSIDVGFQEDETNLKHVTAQLEAFIEFAEKAFPGMVKYDEAKLIELQGYEEEARQYALEMYEMRKHKPSPISGYDAFTGIFGATTPKGVEYARVRRDEMAERVEQGIAGVPGEKLRILWSVTRPFFMNPFKVLAKHQTAVIYFYSGPSGLVTPLPRPDYWKRKLSPLEKVAANVMRSTWGGTGKKWVDGIVWVAKDLDVDAVINYCMLGCTATLGLRKLTEDAVEKELGIPVLQLEGKQWDRDYAGEATLTNQMEEFVQMCLERKNSG
jgi:benzoyl-CoA reductase/2-hydroxyglutaryl-CoA dehydratase subunit BcrC/BadD/HgdB